MGGVVSRARAHKRRRTAGGQAQQEQQQRQAAPSGGATAAAPAQPPLPSLSPDDVSCVICSELLHRPAAAQCGHVFCYMCIFKAMDHLTASRCPLCRAPYRHLPSPCRALAGLVAAAAPEEHAARCKAARQEAVESGMPFPPEEEEAEDAAAGRECAVALRARLVAEGEGRRREQQPPPPPSLLCCPVCKDLLRRPVMLSCGCAVCSACAPPPLGGARASGSSGGGGGGGDAAGGKEQQQQQQPPPQQQRPRCRACNAPVGSRSPQPCKLLCDVIGRYFPEAAEEDKDDDKNEAAARGQGGEQKDGADDDALAAATLLPPEVAAALRQAQLQEGGGGGGAAGEGAAAALAAAIRALRRHADRVYSWHGVGCDGCGAFPIVGRRYRCLDCPEAIGFDLCGECRDAAVAAAAAGADGSLAGKAAGRFNQRHLPTHRLAKVRPALPVLRRVSADGRLVPAGVGDPTTTEEEDEEEGGGEAGGGGASAFTGLLNLLSILHPELPPARVMDLLLMQLGRGGGGGGGGGPSATAGAGDVAGTAPPPPP